MRDVDFFLAGAPKSGTTALARYLSEHPEIFFSRPKEPQYFAFDFPGHRGVKTWDAYMSLFESVPQYVRRIGEGSVWYLYSKVAIPEIKRLFPNALIVIMLRKPEEMVTSLYVQQRRMGIEESPTFEHAWNADSDRRQGRFISPSCKTPEFLFYKDVARYGEQVGRLYEHFSKEQVKIILYDEFSKNPERVYTEILKFLGVSIHSREQFQVVNARADVRSVGLQMWLTYGIQNLRQFKEWVIKHYGIDLAKSGIHRVLIDTARQLNTRVGENNPVSEDLKRDVRRHYCEDTRLLEEILKMDLSHWHNKSNDQ